MSQATQRALRLSLAVLVLQVLALLPSVGASANGVPDEGTVALNGMRLLQGQLPYRDYFTTITPGTDWLVGLWFYCFGDSLVSLRAYFVCMLALVAAAMEALSCRLLPRGWSEMPALMFICAGGQTWHFASFHWDANLFALLALLTLGRNWLSGLCIGLCALVLQTAGVAALLGFSLAHVADLATPRAERLRQWAAMVGGICILWLPFLLWMVLAGIAGAFYYQIFQFNVQHYVAAQSSGMDWDSVGQNILSLPRGFAQLRGFPSGAWLDWLWRATAYVSVDVVKFALFFPVAWVGALWCLKGAPEEHRRQWRALCWTVLGCALLELARPNRYHLTFHTPLWNIVLVGLWWSLYRYARQSRVVAGVGMAVCLAFLLHGVDNVQGWSRYRYPVNYPKGTLWEMDPQSAQAQRQLVAAVAHFCPQQEMFAFPDAPLALWLLGKRNPTRFVAALPLFYTQEQIQDMRGSIDSSRTSSLLFVPVGFSKTDYPFLDERQYQEASEQIRATLCAGFKPVWDNQSAFLFRRDP